MNEFGGYQINKTIQTDDKFVIYEAAHQSKNTPVYLKALKSEFPDLIDVARLQRECNLINQLSSTEIIKTLGIIRQGHRVAMVMEDIPEGVTLHDYCHNKPLNIEQFILIAVQITQGLMTLHENKIIHKELCPNNIIFSVKNNGIKIVNFGASIQADTENSETVGLHIPIASLPYMAPEQTGWVNMNLDYRADFYSLGCTFYEMLTGKAPFSGEKKSDYFKQHISKTPTSITELNTKVPEIIANIVEKLLEKNPENRYQSAYGIYKDLLKCRDLDTKAGISWSFPLAEDDIADKFILSNKLYGREKEISILKQEMTGTIQKNKLGIITVSGFAGVGKSALIKELEQQIKLNNGIVVGGKFDQYQRELPYQALSQAFEEIIDQAIQSDEKEHWINELQKTLGQHGGIITDLIPKLKNILGDLPEPPDLGPKESYNRFLATINQFIQIFSKKDHPLVIFIDDLQWGSGASYNLIQEIARNNENSALILIFSYRSNEIDSTHPMTLLLESLGEIRPISQIELLPLKKEDINKIIADALHGHQKSCEDLAEVIFERSAGNPFFASELLMNLHEQRYIDFDYQRGEWTWDINKIRSVRSSDNVVEFMITRLLQLPPTTLDLLKKAACIGNRFDSPLLAQVAHITIPELLTHLEPAIKAQILIALSNDHDLKGAYDGRTIESQIATSIIFRFQHDRIQQAAYEMTSDAEKPAIHLLIGKTLKNFFSSESSEEKVVSITNHMNKALILIQDENEKLELANLNLAAGIKSKESIAYQTSYGFLKIGISLLSEESWKNNYKLSYELFEEFSQSAFLCGEFAEAKNSNETLLNRAATNLEKARIYRTRAVQYTIIGKSDEAVDACIAGLSLLGITFKKNANTFSVFIEFLSAKLRQGFKSISSLIDLPIMRNAKQLVIMQLLMEMIAPCYTLGNNNLFAKSVLKQVNLSIQYGNTKEAPYAYATYGLLLNAIFNQPSAGFEFGKLAVKLNRHLTDISLRCRILFVFYSFVFPWNKPISELYDRYEEIIKVGYQSGDLLYVSYATNLCLTLQPKDTIGNCLLLGKKYIEMVSATKYTDALNFLKVMQQFRFSLQDRNNSDYFKMNSESEAHFLNELKNSEYDSSVTIYLIKKLADCYLFGDYQKAYEIIDECEKSLEAMLSSVITEEFYVMASLTLARHYPSLEKSLRSPCLKRLKTYHKKVAKWAKHCESNFLQHACLLEATLLRLENKNTKASSLYEKALKAAIDNNFLHDEALICEEIADFYDNTGNEDRATKHRQQAHYAYSKWEASAKILQLESLYPYLRTRKVV